MRSRILLAGAVLAVALGARCYGLFHSSTWFDDAGTMAVVTGRSLDVRVPGVESYSDPQDPRPASFFLHYNSPDPPATVWKVIKACFGMECNPPLSFVIIHCWMLLFGFTMTAGRIFALLPSLAAIPIVFLFARRLAGETAAWIASLLCALAPYQSLLAIQVRGYSFYGVLILAIAWLTFEILEDGPRKFRVVLLICLGVAAMWTHYVGAFYCAFAGLALLTRRELWPTALKVGLIWTVNLAAVAVFFFTQPAWKAHPEKVGSWDAMFLLAGIGRIITEFLVFLPSDADESFAVSMLQSPILHWTLAAAGIALFWIAKRHLPPRQTWFLLVWLAGPSAAVFLHDMLGHHANSTVPRYVAGSPFAMYLLLATGLACLRPMLRWSMAGFLALALIASQIALRELPVGTFADGMDVLLAGRQISDNWQPGDLVIVQSGYPHAPVSLSYYLPPQTPVLAMIYLPRPELGDAVAPATIETMEPRYEKWVAGHPRIWLIRCFAVVPQKITNEWIDAHYRLVVSRQYGGVMTLTEMVRRDRS